MELPYGIFINGIETFLLIFVRVTGLFVVAPIFGQRNAPAYLKIGLSFMIALILSNVVPIVDFEEVLNIYVYVLIILKEFITGIIIGYVSYLVFTAIYLAGQIIDMQMGFGIVNVMDPVSNIQVPITSNFYFVLCMVMFLSMNGHHLMIKALYDSFSFIPLGKTVLDNALLTDMTRMLGNIFILGFKISAPIVASMLIIDMALGVMMKTIPQLNIFVVGMPLKILAGFLILLTVTPIFVLLVEMIINGVNSEMYNFIKHMVPK